MGYTYKDCKSFVFTEAGINNILKMQAEAMRLTKKSGCFLAGKLLLSNCTGDSWSMMACVDHLVLNGFLVERTSIDDCAWQDRVLSGAW